eukprot:10436701-Lingulodinium_polyedra.AAC.1
MSARDHIDGHLRQQSQFPGRPDAARVVAAARGLRAPVVLEFDCREAPRARRRLRRLERPVL